MARFEGERGVEGGRGLNVGWFTWPSLAGESGG